MTTLCTQCGFHNPPGMRFCGNCGTRLVEADPPPAEPAAKDTSPQALGAMMGADLLERFRKAGLEASGQRRNVTVLFVDLSGYTQLSEQIDPEDLYELVQEYIQLLANDVYKYEGMVDKFTGDGLMALFGAPIANENNAELAVRSALDMLADVARLSAQMKDRLPVGLQVHIGLNAGTVIVGGIGSNMLMNYTAIGDTVNLAQRLENAAPPGAILVSESVYRQTKPIFDYNPSPTLQLKGITHPIKGYSLIGSKVKPGRVRGIEGLSAPLVGRDQELAEMKKGLKLLEHGEGRFVLITGEAGMGKSRLTAELKESLYRRPVALIEGQSLTYRRAVAYWIFIDLIRNYLGLVVDPTAEQFHQRLAQIARETMGHRAEEVLPYLEHMLSLPPSDPAAAERISYLEAGQLRKQIFMAVRDLFVAETNRQPVVMVLEDLHWADESSLDLLAFLLDSVRTSPIMVVAISRPIQDGPMSHIAEWAGQHLEDQFCSIALQSLSQVQSEELLFQLVQIPEWGPALRSDILQRAAGIPFYLEEILRMLIEQGVLHQENGHWAVVPGADIRSLDVPDTLEGLILARFDRLEETQRRLLQVAAVIGRQFNFQVLQKVMPFLAPEQIDVSMAKLVKREFLQPQPETPQVEYSFRHTLMSDAIYKTILRKELRDLHGQIGQAIESIYADRIESQIEILARHYSWSPFIEKAFHYLTLAGQKAARNYANTQARQHFEQAIELLPQANQPADRAAVVFAGLGDVLSFTGEYPLARERFETALARLASEPRDGFVELESDLLRKIGTTYERQGEYEQAIECLDKAQHALPQAADAFPIHKAQILNDKGWIYMRRGNIEAADQNLSQALDLVENTSQYDVIASIYNRLGGIYFQKDDLGQAIKFVRKSLVLREELGDTIAVARSYNNLGLIEWKRGDWNNALESFQRSMELNATLGDVEAILNLHLNIGLLQTDRGEMEEAESHLQEAQAIAQQIGHSFLEGTADLHLSRLWLATGGWTRALDHCQRSLEIFQEIGAQENQVDLYASIGEAYLGLEDVQQATQACQSAVKIFQETSAQGTPPTELGRIYRLQGNLARLSEDYDASSQYLRKSAEEFSALDNKLEIGRTTLAQALLAEARLDKILARVHANEARLIFRQLGAKFDLQAVDNLLSRLA